MKYNIPSSFQMKSRGVLQLARKLTAEEKTGRQKKFEQFVEKARRETEREDSCSQMDHSETTVGDAMLQLFPDYVPLNNHLMRYEMANILKQHSKLTPASQLSVYNLYTGGEGQSEERMKGKTARKVSSAAQEFEESDDCEWQFSGLEFIL